MNSLKKWGKKSLSILFVGVLLVSFAAMAFAEGSSADSDSSSSSASIDSSVVVDNSSSAEDDSSVVQDEDTAPPTAPPPAQAPPAQAPPAQAPPVGYGAPGTPSVTASISGSSGGAQTGEIPLGVGSSFSTDAYTGVYTGMTLIINATFDGAASVTQRQIKVSLAIGLAFKSLPGVKINVANRTVDAFNHSLLAEQEKDVLSDITVNTRAPLAANNKETNQLGGDAVISVEDGVVSLEIKITIMYDTLYMAKQDAAKAILDAVQIDVSQTDGETPETASIKLEKFTCTSKAGPVIYRSGGFDTYYLPGASVDMKYFINSTVESYTNTSSEPVYYKELIFEISIPKNVYDYRESSLINSVSFSGGWKITTDRLIEDVSNSTHYILRFTLKDFILNFSVFTMRLKVKTDAPVGSCTAKSSIKGLTMYDGTVYNTVPFCGSEQSWTMNVTNASGIVEPSAYSGLNIAYAAPSDVASGENVYLGSVFFQNKTGAAIASQKVTFDFSASTDYGVRLVRLPVGADKRANSLRVFLSNGQMYDFTTMTNGFQQNSTAPYVVLDVRKICTDKSISFYNTLYIEKIEYTIDKMADTYASGDTIKAANLPSHHSAAIFGVFTGNKPAYISFTVTNSNAAGTDTKSVTPTYNVREKGLIGFTSSATVTPEESSPETIEANKTVAVRGGKFFTVNASFSLYAQASTSKHQNTTEYAPAYYNRGYVFYIRTLDCMTISDLKVTSNLTGTAYTAGSGLTISTIQDNTGKDVLKIVASQLSMGMSAKSNTTAKSLSVDIYYKATLKKASPILSVNFSDLLFIRSTIPNIAGDYNGNIKYYNELDNFGISGTTDPTHDAMGTMHNGAVLKITGEEDFTVITSSRMTMDGNTSAWVTYDFDDTNTNPNRTDILGLSPLGNVEYKVEIVNNSGKNCNGYSILIYIPKAGEGVTGLNANGGSMQPIHIQKENFQWSTWLTEQLTIVSTNGYDYTVKYSTSYQTTTEGVFEDWNDANKMEYRTIMVSTVDIVADGDEDDFSFNLNVPAENPEDYAGLTNIYAARVFRKLGTAETYKPSQPIAVTLNTAAVKGRVYIDENWSGSYEAKTDKVLAGVELKAYRDNPLFPGQKELLKTLFSDANGEYSFPLYKKSDVAWVEAVNPSTNDNYRFSANTLKPLNQLEFERDGAAGELRYAGNLVTFDIGFERRCVVSFNANGGTPNNTVKEFRNTIITLEEMKKITPEQAGHIFLGWYMGGEKGQYVVGEEAYTVTGDIIMYARWTGDRFNLRYWVGDKSTNHKVGVGAKLKDSAPPAVSAPKGMQFTGWADAGGKTWQVSTQLMPAYDLDLYAQFATADASDSSKTSEPKKTVPKTGNDASEGTTVPALAVDGKWALLSLIGMIIGLLCAVVALVSLLGTKAKKVTKIAAIILGAITVPLFFLMNSLGGTMAFVNVSTWFIVPLALVALVFMLLSVQKKKTGDEDAAQSSHGGYNT